jgi:hypothetical protein
MRIWKQICTATVAPILLYAEKALALLDAHQSPASSWSDTEQRREEIRNGILRVLKESQAIGAGP